MIEIKSGATRTVLLIGRFAVKIPRVCSYRNFLNGILANLQERMFWKIMRHKNLARVFYADPAGIILVIERADETYCEFGRKGMEDFF